MQKYDYSILFVEDEEDVRKNYVAYLQRYFSNVYEVGDAKEAYQVYKEKKPSILIIDVNLPGESGIEFLQKVREHDYATKAIMLTAMSDVETLLRVSDLKLTKYLVKPISRGELQEALEMAVEEMQNFTIYSNDIIALKDSYTWDKKGKKLFKNGVEQMLTKKEIALLALLFSNTNRTFNTEDIIFELWYDTDTEKVSSLKTLIKQLRKKLPENTIKNVFGIGYKVEISS
jgi:DNA-binding response OmpR family regulator